MKFLPRLLLTAERWSIDIAAKEAAHKHPLRALRATLHVVLAKWMVRCGAVQNVT